MRAYITSIGESTTELCVWSLERCGFEVVLLKDSSSLWSKLKTIFETEDKDFLRVDADTIVNKNVIKLVTQTELWWYQALCYDWFKQDVGHGGVQFIRQQAIPIVRKHINEAERLDRPESYLFRLKEFHDPRMCGTFEQICGLHGYKQTDFNRVVHIKANRNQLKNYDFDLAQKVETL